jgi:UMF1 family MFS transporter
VRGPGPAGSNGRAPALAVWSWVLYDFSNTIFSISILSYFFPLWLREELGAEPDLFNYMSAASAFIIAFTAPFLGALADLQQRRRSYLIILPFSRSRRRGHWISPVAYSREWCSS